MSQRAVRIGFYLWLSLLNLVATSTLWARAADAFDSNAAKRLFGFLGAGATLGVSTFPHSAAGLHWCPLPYPALQSKHLKQFFCPETYPALHCFCRAVHNPMQSFS